MPATKAKTKGKEISARYLLYIDVLNFAAIAASNREKVDQIYRILDSLNAHRHPNFKAIAFSDTILIYNSEPVTSRQDAEYTVWYLIEFAEDLHHRFTGQDLFFRAVLVDGEFTHYTLENVQCFFGQALIDAYRLEKEVPGIGLFISDRCNALNRYFRTARFDRILSFVYLNRSLESLQQFSGGVYPVSYPGIADEAPHVPWQVEFLKSIYRGMRDEAMPLVRAKYLTTWDYYMQRYPEMLQALVSGDFALSSLAKKGAWRGEIAAMNKDISHFSKAKRTKS